MNWKDQRVVRAMKGRYPEFLELAIQCYQNPGARPEVERQMKAALESMTEEERIELRAALNAARRK